jgi:hypothetical protein
VVEGEGEAEEEDDEDDGLGGGVPDLFRMDQAGCQCRRAVNWGADLDWCFRSYIGKSEGLVISDPEFKAQV